MDIVPQRQQAEPAHRIDGVAAMASAGRFSDALVLIRGARNADPRNIYLIALEKQVERVKRLSANPAEAAQRDELLATIPSLVQRAALSPSARMNPGQPQPPSPPPVQEGEDKRLAIERLKGEFFGHADEHMQCGDYASALVEIRRVLILDPGDAAARQYERKVLDLESTRKARQEAPAEPADTMPEHSDNAADDHGDAPDLPWAPVSDLPVRVYDEEHLESPAVLALPVSAQTEPADGETPDQPRPGKGRILGFVVAAGLVFAVLRIVLTTGEAETTPALEAMTPVRVEAAQVHGSAGDEPAMPEVESIIKEEERAARRLMEQQSQKASEETPTPVIAPTPKKNAAKADEEQLAKFEAAKPKPAPMLESGSGTEDVVYLQSPPHIVTMEAPLFDDVPRDARTHGPVSARVRVGARGKALEVSIVQSPDERLNGPVTDALMKSTYQPGLTAKGKVEAWMAISVPVKP